MRSTASALSAISNDTTSHTAGAVKTSGDAFESVEVAANAAEEMSKSIAEINHQLARATEVVRAATGLGLKEAKALLDELSNSPR